jgi:thioredoxin 1
LVKDIQHTDFQSEVLASDRPTVVEFWHNQCPACEEMRPIYEALEGHLSGRVRLTRMNLLESRENRVLAIRQGARSTPTFMIYCGGRPIGAIIGVRTLGEMESELGALLRVSDSCLRATPIG